jgi:hypothetical protein
MPVVILIWILQGSQSIARRAFFQRDSLPAVRVADDGLEEGGAVEHGQHKHELNQVSHTFKHPYEFSVDMFTHNIPVWEKALARFKDQPDIHYLEIGLAEGMSAVWMLENILTHSSARLTGLDLFAGRFTEDVYKANITRSGMEEKTTTLKGYSQELLRTLPLDTYDIVYIDGSHRINDVLEDAILSWRLLKDNGIMIFDDYRYLRDRWHVPKVAIDAFADCFGDQFEVIHNSYQLILQKKQQ